VAASNHPPTVLHISLKAPLTYYQGLDPALEAVAGPNHRPYPHSASADPYKCLHTTNHHQPA